MPLAVGTSASLIPPLAITRPWARDKNGTVSYCCQVAAHSLCPSFHVLVTITSFYGFTFYDLYSLTDASAWVRHLREITLVVLIWGCVNDFYMLTWDIYTYGSFLASAIPQIFTSLAFMTTLILSMVYFGWPDFDSIPFICIVLSLLISVITLAVTVTLWIRGQSRSWGIREPFGKRRPPDDKVRRVVRKGWKVTKWSVAKALPFWLENVIYRRIEHVESTQYAMTRNIVAIILLSLLVAQTVILVHGVIYEKFSTQEIWDVPVYDTHEGFCCMLIFYDTNQTWSVYARLTPSTDVQSTNDILFGSMVECYQNTCYSSGMSSFQLCRTTTPIDIVMAVGNSSSSAPDRIWLSYGGFYDDGVTRVYDHGIHLTPGYQHFGLVDIIERRIINGRFSDMLGLNPVRVLVCSLVCA